MVDTRYTIKPIGVIRSELVGREEAPRQGYEGGPDAWLEVNPTVAEGLDGIAVGDELIIITWLHETQRSLLKTHPRGDMNAALKGVYATRSPDTPNPLELHRVVVYEIAGNSLKVGPIKAIDGTPVVDIKPVLSQTLESL